VSAAAILAQARDVLSGTAASRNRVACWLARSALEEVVSDLLVAKGRGPGDATMASRLTCLEIAYEDDPVVADRAEFAWCQLSNACHQHAFELSPTASEAASLIEIVSGLHRVCGDHAAPSC